MKCFFFKLKSYIKTGLQNPSKYQPLNGTSSSLSSPTSMQELDEEKELNCGVFTLEELKDATNGFKQMLEIGKGRYESVYRGTLRPRDKQGDPILVAIKKLNPYIKEHKEWVAEVQSLSTIDHPNLVKLMGYCSVDRGREIQRLLVYEFMSNGTLEDHLFYPSLPHLPWETRLQIILGAAQGLHYLHEGLEVQVIYGDFRSSKVLLDMKFHPKLSVFVLAREAITDDNIGECRTDVGTTGYVDLEYALTGHLRVQSDIWSFGVVLYEILTGRRVLERSRPKGEQELLEWVKNYPVDSSRFSIIMDPRLRNQYPVGAARIIAKLADSCLKKNPKDRPPMSQIVESLNKALQHSQNTNTSHNMTSLSSPAKLVWKGK